MEGHGTKNGGLGAAVCVLWHAHGRTPADELFRALERTGVDVVLASGPFLALAEVCRLRRESGRPVVLIVDATGALPNRAEVVRLVHQHAPGALCWVYQPSAAERLRAVIDSDLRGWEQEEAAAERPAPNVVVRPVQTNGHRPAAPGPRADVKPLSTPARPSSSSVSPPKEPEPRPAAANPARPALRSTDERLGPIGQVGDGGKPVPRTPARGGASLRLIDAPEVHPAAGIADVPKAGDAPGHEPAAARVGPAQLLTQEELAMLLAEDDPT